MAFLIKSLNRRWSLYVVKDNKSAYAMHANSVMHIVGHVMGYFESCQVPVSPWALYLCTNGKQLKLGSEHFTSDGENPTPLLVNQIKAMDSRWDGFKAGAIWFEDVETKKDIKISDYKPGQMDWNKYIQSMLDNPEHSKEPSFYSVMNEVFGKH